VRFAYGGLVVTISGCDWLLFVRNLMMPDLPDSSTDGNACRAQAESAPTFEQALERLERIVAELERGEIELAAALAEYEEGIKLLAHCRRLLDDADRKVAILTGVDQDGEAKTAPFDATATFDPGSPTGKAGSSRAQSDSGGGRKVRSTPRASSSEPVEPPF